MSWKTYSLLFLMTAVIVSGLAAGPATADHHNKLRLADKEGVGKFIVDGNGMTLYVFQKDSPGKSACTGQCVDRWPIFYVPAVVPQEGLDAKDFGVIDREDGKKQVTYKGWPLYYFVQDKTAGDTLGQGVNNVWYVADPSKIK